MFLLAAFLSIPPLILAQQQDSLTIKGKIVDDETGVPLYGVNVFLANTTIGTSSGKDGKFTITNVPFGSYDLIFSHVGYEIEKKSFHSYEAGVFEYNISLKPKMVSLKEITVTGTVPEDWKDNLEIFTKVFIGETENSRKTRILNPEVLDFVRDPSTDVLRAYSDSVIRVENDALGFMLYISLDSLVYDVRGETVLYRTYSRFVELPPVSEGERLTWEDNRQMTYLVSSRHFFCSLIHKQLDVDRYSLSQGSSISGIRSGFARRLVPGDLDLTTDRDSILYTFNFTGVLEVQSDQASLSYLEFLFPSVSIDKYGNLLQFDYSTKTYGYWANERIADLLPQNYVYKGK